jgi:hypothetical protein
MLHKNLKSWNWNNYHICASEEHPGYFVMAKYDKERHG